MDTDNLKHEARELERQGRFREALAMYRHILTSVEGTPAYLQELPLYVKAGDLYLKLENPKAAVSLYEQAGKVYALHGSANSVTAICAKVLRVMPERTHVYRRFVRSMVDHGHVEAGRAVMVEWAARFRLADTRRALERLAGRSESELLPAMLMLLELAERVESEEDEEPPEMPSPRGPVQIAEIEPESAAAEPVERVPPRAEEPAVGAEREAKGDTEGDAEGDAVRVEKAGGSGPVLHSASWSDNPFRSERFGAESLTSHDDESEQTAATPDDNSGAPTEPDDLVIVPGHLLPDEPELPGGRPPPASAASNDWEARPPSSPEELDEPNGRTTTPRMRPAELEPEPQPRRRVTPPRRSTMDSILMASPLLEDRRPRWKLWVGVAGAVLLVVLLWLALGLPPFGRSGPDVGAATTDSAEGGAIVVALEQASGS